MKRKMICLLVLTIMLAPIVVTAADYAYPGKAIQHSESLEKINDAVAHAIKEGKLKDMMPPTIVMVFGVMVPITAIAGFFTFLIVFVKLNHRRSILMIEKGVTQPVVKRRWDLAFLFVGLILSFLGVGISLTTVSYFGPQPWTFMSGVIPLFIGIAFLLFYRLSDLKNQEK
ncbi:MAG: hypothetical protein GY754_03630 [bacterium]|nr:hypothetical protein [bacterium]